MTRKQTLARKSRFPESPVLPILICARAAAPHRALVSRAARRLGLTASIPRASDKERLAGSTRGRGSPLAIAITAPSAGAAVNRSRALHSVPRAGVAVAMLTLLRVPFQLRRCAFGARLKGSAAPDRRCLNKLILGRCPLGRLPRAKDESNRFQEFDRIAEGRTDDRFE